jgi:hypothetical protein
VFIPLKSTNVSEEHVTAIFRVNEKAKQKEKQNNAGSKQILVSCLAYSLTLMMEATCSTETTVGFQRTIQLYTREYKTPHKHGREKLRSYLLYSVARSDYFACQFFHSFHPVIYDIDGIRAVYTTAK